MASAARDSVSGRWSGDDARVPSSFRAGGVSAVLIALAAIGCSSDAATPEPLGVRVNDRGETELVTVCSDRVSATVTETDQTVRIEDIDGDVISGADCEGVVTLDLAMPVGDRTVVVGGEEWVALSATCPWGFVGPADLGERLPTCAPDPD